MKKLKCEICDFEGRGETFDEWFEGMHKHYQTAHADIMKEMMDKPKEEMDKWMVEARAKFDAI